MHAAAIILKLSSEFSIVMELAVHFPASKRVKQEPGDHPKLPEELIFDEILSRVPVESVLRFRCVTSSWNNSIRTKPFMKAHLKKSIESSSFFDLHTIFFETIRGFKLLSLPSLFDNPSRTDPIPCNEDLGIDFRDEVTDLVGSCNGLVCLLLDSKRFILWNPATKKSRRLPDPSNHPQLLRNRESIHFVKFGFGLDEVTDDYKVSVLVKKNCVIAGAPECHWFQVTYSLRTNAWINIQERPPDSISGKGMGMYVSGKLHWSLVKANGYDVESFDLNSHVFGVVELPASYPQEAELSLGVVGGCLSAQFRNLDSDLLDVWVMKVYGVKESWDKVVTIPLIRPADIGMPRYLAIRPTGEVLLIYALNGAQIYNPIRNVYRTPRITGYAKFCFYACSGMYIESLACV